MTKYSFLPVLLKFGVEDTLYKIAYIRNVPSVINLHDLFQIVTYFSLDYTGESHDMFIGTQGRKFLITCLGDLPPTGRSWPNYC